MKKLNSTDVNQGLPLLSVCVPVLNEESNIKPLHSRLSKLSKKMQSRCSFEFIFTDNHSRDRTWDIISEIAAIDDRVKAIKFSRNFGFQNSILENFRHSNGDAVVQIDADLQDPPELIEKFFEKWVDGFHVVYGIRASRVENPLMNGFRKLGYRFINFVCGAQIPNDAGDFRLIDRKVVNALLNIREVNPYIRGAIAEIGFEQVGVRYARSERKSGKSKFGIYRLFALGLTAIFNHSLIPIRLSIFIGALILFFSLIGACYYLFLKAVDESLPRGLASIHILTLAGIGINSFFIGILGEYVYRVHTLLKGEKKPIVQEKINL